MLGISGLAVFLREVVGLVALYTRRWRLMKGLGNRYLAQAQAGILGKFGRNLESSLS